MTCFVRMPRPLLLTVALLAAGSAVSCRPGRPGSLQPGDVGEYRRYRLRGRVMDGADPKQGLGRARLRLEMLAQGGGRPIVYKTYGVTTIDGTFDLELRAPFENASTATIVLTVAKPGYKIVKVRVRPPAKKREYYTTEPITLPPEPPAPPFGVEEPDAGGEVVVPEMPKDVPWR